MKKFTFWFGAIMIVCSMIALLVAGFIFVHIGKRALWILLTGCLMLLFGNMLIESVSEPSD